MTTAKKKKADKRRQKAFEASLADRFDALKGSKFESDNETLEKLLKLAEAKK